MEQGITSVSMARSARARASRSPVSEANSIEPNGGGAVPSPIEARSALFVNGIAEKERKDAAPASKSNKHMMANWLIKEAEQPGIRISDIL